MPSSHRFPIQRGSHQLKGGREVVAMHQSEIPDVPREFEIFAQVFFTEPSDRPVSHEELIMRTIKCIPWNGGKITTFKLFIDHLLNEDYSDNVLARVWNNSQPR